MELRYNFMGPQTHLHDQIVIVSVAAWRGKSIEFETRQGRLNYFQFPQGFYITTNSSQAMRLDLDIERLPESRGRGSALSREASIEKATAIWGKNKQYPVIRD